MLTYHQFEEEIFNLLYHKYLLENRFTFSVRKKKNKNAENDYFIGTKKSNYFAFTLWDIPVWYKGASIDLVAYVLRRREGAYRCYCQFFISRTAPDDQNKYNIEFGEILKQELSKKYEIKVINSNKSLHFIVARISRENFSDFSCELESYISNTSKIVNRAINKVKLKNPAWLARKIELDKFHSSISRLSERLKIDFPEEYDELISSKEQAGIDEIMNSTEYDETEKKSLVKSRLGQGEFRKNLLKLQKKCVISGIGKKNLLRASHIKEWRYSTNQERLDPYNGLLLLPNYDLLFDRHLITFDETGKILISPKLSSVELNKLGIDKDIMIRLKERNQPYLAYHRGIFHSRNK